MLTRSAAILALAASLFGCSSQMVPIAPALPDRYQDLGPAVGRACGVHIALIPFALNSRIDRAYQAAVARVPGAVALRDVTMTDDWSWIVVGTLWCATVKGIAIR